MEDFDFPTLLNQARKIDDGLYTVAQKLQNPTSIGVGQAADIRLDELERDLSTHEEMLNTFYNSLKKDLCELKLRNQQKNEFITNLKTEINKIEEIGKEHGFVIPNFEMSQLNIDDISPLRSPREMSYQATPLSAASISVNSTPFFS